MIEFRGAITGPFKPGQEAEFKAKVLAFNRLRSLNYRWYCIESEETEPGFPDILGATKEPPWLYSNVEKPTLFVETKVTHANGVAEFQKSQPLWYKNNHGMAVEIWCWDTVNSRLVIMTMEDVIDQKSTHIRIPKDLPVVVCAHHGARYKQN